MIHGKSNKPSTPSIHTLFRFSSNKLIVCCFMWNSIPHSGILDTILSVQPKEGGGGGGETRESIVYQLAEDMLRKLPPQYNAFEVREALNRMGSLLPMNIFFR